MNETTGEENADPSGSSQWPEVDWNAPSTARMTHHWLGGRTSYFADRNAADDLLDAWPLASDAARAQRLHLQETIAARAAAGTAQFLDLGSGLPFGGMRGLLDAHHAVAQAAPDGASITVYVDNHTEVAVHLEGLLDPIGDHRVHSRAADIRDPDLLPALCKDRILDPVRPVAVIIADVLQEIPDDQAHALLAALARDLAPSSTLTITHPAPSLYNSARLTRAYDEIGLAWHPRTTAQAADLLAHWLPSAQVDVTECDGFWAATVTIPSTRNPARIGDTS